MRRYFILASGQLIVAIGAGDDYVPEEGSTEIAAPPEHDPETHRTDWVNGAWVITPLPIPIIEISAEVLFFDRMTDDEYDALDDSVRAGETARVYRGWAAAITFTEGTAMWTLLDKHLSLVVTAERKAELLARPRESAVLADEAMAV